MKGRPASRRPYPCRIALSSCWVCRLQSLELMGHIHVVRSEVTADLGEGDQGGDVTLEGLHGQEKPLVIEQAPLDVVAIDVLLAPLVALGLVIALGERRRAVLNHFA